MTVWVVIWLIIALLAAVGEVATTGLFLASIAAAAVLAAVSALFLPLIVQAAVFAVAGLGGIAFLRPIIANALGMHSTDLLAGPVSQSHLIGRRAIVTHTVDPSGGQIRIGQGEFWTARPFDGSDVIQPGTPVEILLVDGLTALVAPVEQPDSGDSLPYPQTVADESGQSESQTKGAGGAKGITP
jgi:membrane protein implicated in regulation of membrane protease activity